MRAKALLKSIRSLRKEIELLQQEERLMLSPKGIAYDGVKVQTSPKDRMLETVEMIQELEDTIAVRLIEGYAHPVSQMQATAADGRIQLTAM